MKPRTDNVNLDLPRWLCQSDKIPLVSNRDNRGDGKIEINSKERSRKEDRELGFPRETLNEFRAG